MVVLNG